MIAKGRTRCFGVSVTKLRLKPLSEAPWASESSLLGGRCAAAKTASKASLAKTCSISPEHGFRRCLVCLAIVIQAACGRGTGKSDTRERAYRANNRGVAQLEQLK